MKIVIIGAGSYIFGRGQVADLLQSKELMGRGITLSLVDENTEALEKMHGVARLIAQHSGADMKLEATTDRRKALGGAKYVITAVSRKRMPLWEQDFRVPLAHGFRHCLGENGGPGAIFHALRSFDLILPICRDMEELCPEALLLNFTNPEARVLHAVLHLTKIKAIGICHGIFSALEAIEGYLKRPIDDFHVVSAGINHFYAILSAKDKKTGQEYLPQLIQMAANDPSPKCPPLFRKMAQVFDIFTFPSDDHIGEYLSFGWEYHGVKWIYGQENRRLYINPPASNDWPPLDDYNEGRRQVDDWLLSASGEITVPVICDMELNRGNWRHAVNVLNTEGLIDNLPLRAAVEVPAIVDAQGVHPQKVGAVPEPFASYLRTQVAIHETLTEAYRTRSRKLLLRALLLDPCVTSITEAEKLLGEMLELQKDFLPAFDNA